MSRLNKLSSPKTIVTMQQNLYPGKFIVFEGLDGSGQSTEAEKLVTFLNQKAGKSFSGQPAAYLTKEPTNNLIGGLIRAQLTHEWKSSPECLQLLFSADRAHHLQREIIPLLEKGVTVVSDRYFFSTLAYGSMAIDDWEWLKKINNRFLLPDIWLILKVSPKICLERMKKSRFELDLFEEEQVMEKVWQGFERTASEFENTYLINGEQSIEEVFENIKKIIKEKLNI